MAEYVYHITSEMWPSKVKLSPKTPINLSFGEPTTPRICVCNDVYKCFLAVGRVLLNQNCKYVKIYKSVKKVDAVTATLIYDYWITDEKWLMDDCEFEYCNSIFLNKQLIKTLKPFPYIHKTNKLKAVNKAKQLFDCIDKSVLY